MSADYAKPPRITVVMPTHNRAGTLTRAMDALAKQTCGPQAFDVVLVADGCTDDTVSKARSLQLPFVLQVLETGEGGRGAAAARNLGVRVARAPLLLFLDDDMEADPGLIEAHLQAHEGCERTVVLGRFTMPDRGFVTDPFQTGTSAWWSGRFSEMRQPGHRFTFQDLFAGHVSMSRSLLEEAGGFEAGFVGKSGEDYELAVRLLRCGAKLVFEPRATSVHHDAPTVARSLNRARAEGRGHVVMLRRHPDLYPHLRMYEVVGGLKRSLLWRWIWTRPRLAEALASAMMPLVHATRVLRMRQLYRGLYGSQQRSRYWMGVRDELGTLAQLQRFVQDLPLSPVEAREVEVDLSHGWDRVCEQLETEDADGVRLRWGSRPIGRVAPVAGAEPLRGRHLAELVPVRFAHVLMLVGPDNESEAGAIADEPRLRYSTYSEAV